MAKFWTWLFRVSDGERSAWDVIVWWEMRRVPYNLIVGTVGFLSLVISYVCIRAAGVPDPGEGAVELMVVRSGLRADLGLAILVLEALAVFIDFGVIRIRDRCLDGQCAVRDSSRTDWSRLDGEERAYLKCAFENPEVHSLSFTSDTSMTRPWYSVRPTYKSAIVILAILAGAAYAVFLSQSSEGPPVFVISYAAFLASLMALFKELIADWIWGPVLEVSYHQDHDYCERAVRPSPQGLTTAYYFRVLVRNVGHRRAEDVEVMATNLYEVDHGGTRKLVHRYLVNLMWTHKNITVLDGISPQMERFCDIGFYASGASFGTTIASHGECDLSKGPPAFFSLSVESIPNNLSHMLCRGSFELELQISASNCRPIKKKLLIRTSGVWAERPIESMSEDICIELCK